MHYFPDVAIFALVLLVLFASGIHTALPQSKNRVSPEDLLLGVAASLGSWSLTIWIFGHAKVTDLGVYAVGISMLLVVSALGVDKGRHITAHFKAIVRFFRDLRGLELALACYLFAIFALTFVLTLAPPNGQDYDSLMYHLAAPAQYGRGGHIRELPYDHHTYFPFSMEMLYLLGLQLRGPVLAKMFHWLMLVLSCGALICIGRRHLTRRAGFLAAALFASLPLVQAEVSTAYADLGLTAFVLMAFLCFSNWLQERDENTSARPSIAKHATIHEKTGVEKTAKNKRARADLERKEVQARDATIENGAIENKARAHGEKWLVWSGVFCGFCLGMKYLGALTFAWLLAWAIGRMARDKSFQFRPLALFCAWAILLGGGWYARNWIQTGNPVFPFAYGVFGGRGWNADMATAYSADQASFGYGRAPLDWILLPWRMAMAPLNLMVAPPRQIVALPFWPLSDAVLANGMKGKFEVDAMLLQSVLGPSLLALGAPLLFVKRKPRVVGFALWSFLWFFVFWGLTGQYMRYLVPAFALLCVACGWGADKYLGRGALLKWTCGVFLACWLAFVPGLTLWNARSVLPVVLGSVTPHEYLSRTVYGYTAMRRASTQTPPDARFAVYGEPRCFYLERDYFWADDPHNNLIDYARIKTGGDFIQALRQQKATHILQNLDPGGTGAIGSPPPQMEAAVASGQLKLLFEESGYRVYQIANSSMTSEMAGGSATR